MLAPFHFSKDPGCDLESLISYDQNNPVKDFNELFSSTKNIGNWKDLCGALKVSDATMEELEFSDQPDIHKKKKCLKYYFDNGNSDWKEVVAAIVNYPISNKREACKIAHKYIMKKTEEI